MDPMIGTTTVVILFLLAILVGGGIGIAVALIVRHRAARAEPQVEQAVNLARMFQTMMQQSAPAAAAKPRHLPMIMTDNVRVCGRCVFFDLEEGQAVIRNNPIFAEAARWVTPRRMGTRFETDEKGDLLPPELQNDPGIPERCEWTAFGACLKHQQVIWAEQDVDAMKLDSRDEPGCPDFALSTPASRVDA